MIRETRGWTGTITVTRYLADGTETSETFQNIITDVGLDLLASAIGGVDAEIYYMGWGDDATAPASGDTTLGNELGRKQVTSQAAGSTGEYDTVVYLSPTDTIGTIEELGWFAGASASATAGSGVMVARVLYSTTKTTDESIQVDRTDTLA